jgi:Zn-dependent peptidase ImmA (M78 family)
VPGIEDLYDVAKVLGRDVSEFLPRELTDRPLKGLMRAIAAELPVGERLQASLEIFLRGVAMSLPPKREIELDADEPEELAVKLLKKARVDRPPVDVVGLARRCGLRVVPWAAMDAPISGMLVQLEGPLIIYNGSDVAERQRFTVAHELGHYLMNHLREFHVDLTAPVGEERPGYKRNQEKAANAFAAELLMPAAWMNKQRRESLDDLATRFEVSEIAMGYRMNSLGLS